MIIWLEQMFQKEQIYIPISKQSLLQMKRMVSRIITLVIHCMHFIAILILNHQLQIIQQQKLQKLEKRAAAPVVAAGEASQEETDQESESEAEDATQESGPEPEPAEVVAAEDSEQDAEAGANAPEETDEPVEAPQAPSEPDDLKRIEGIGPKIASILHERGDTELAEQVDVLMETLAEGSFPRSNWIFVITENQPADAFEAITEQSSVVENLTCVHLQLDGLGDLIDTLFDSPLPKPDANT